MYERQDDFVRSLHASIQGQPWLPLRLPQPRRTSASSRDDGRDPAPHRAAAAPRDPQAEGTGAG